MLTSVPITGNMSVRGFKHYDTYVCGVRRLDMSLYISYTTCIYMQLFLKGPFRFLNCGHLEAHFAFAFEFRFAFELRLRTHGSRP